MKILIVGGMKKAEFLIQSLLEKNHEIKVIHDQSEYCKWLSRSYDISVICGDASKHFILEEADINNYDLVIAMTPKDEDNLVICQLAKKYFNVKKTFSTVSNPKNVELFKKLGVDNVTSSTYIVAGIIEEMAIRDDLANYLKIEKSGIGILEFQIKTQFYACNRCIYELGLPDKTLIAYIIRGDRYIVPNGKTKILENDKIILLCPQTLNNQIVDSIMGKVKKHA